jgi:hypothetical protein
MTPRGVLLTVAVVAVALLGGALKFAGVSLGTGDAAAPTATAPTTIKLAKATADPPTTTPAPEPREAERPAVALEPIVAQRLPDSAEQAVRTFADAYVNWRAATAVESFRRLAGLADYQAQQVALDRARQMQAQGTAAARANEGQLQTVRGRGRGRFVVVAREQATAAGAPVGPERFVAYLVVAQHTPRGWQITTWKEQQ